MRRVSRGVLRKLARLSPGEWRDLVLAQLALIAAQITVWTRPRGRLVANDGPDRQELEANGAAPDDQSEVSYDPATESRARQLALAVSRAAGFGLFRPFCLVRAVALRNMLEARGIRGSLVRIGVRWQRGKFEAHAWVEYGPLILGDTEAHVDRFMTLSDVSVRHGR